MNLFEFSQKVFFQIRVFRHNQKYRLRESFLNKSLCQIFLQPEILGKVKFLICLPCLETFLNTYPTKCYTKGLVDTTGCLKPIFIICYFHFSEKKDCFQKSSSCGPLTVFFFTFLEYHPAISPVKCSIGKPGFDNLLRKSYGFPKVFF